MTGATVCPHPGCPNIRPCPTPGHERVPWATSDRRRRLPPNWANKRARVLRRDPLCRMCHVEPSTEVDHINNNDDHAMANLQGLCSACHLAKTLIEATLGRRRPT